MSPAEVIERLKPTTKQQLACIDTIFKIVQQSTPVAAFGISLHVAQCFSFDGKPLLTGSPLQEEKIRCQLNDRAVDNVIDFMTSVGLLRYESKLVKDTGGFGMGLSEYDYLQPGFWGKVYLSLPRRLAHVLARLLGFSLGVRKIAMWVRVGTAIVSAASFLWAFYRNYQRISIVMAIAFGMILSGIFRHVTGSFDDV
jgi:hypothetical protein